jgi:HK97 family phage prohead protease
MRLQYKNFALSDLKAAAEAGHFTGKASVYGVVDSYNDVVMPGAFTKSLASKGNRVKVLAQHCPEDVIGLATLTDTPDALLVSDGALELGLQSAQDMYTRVKGGLIDGISIGYVCQNATFDKNGLRQLNEIDLWEVSLVTFPANPFATVTGIKSRARRLAALKAVDGMDASVADALSAIDAQIDDLDTAFDDLLAMLGIADPDEDGGKTIDGMLREIKAGRMISAANMDKLKSAITALQAVCDAAEASKNADTLKSENAETLALAIAASEALGKFLAQ